MLDAGLEWLTGRTWPRLVGVVSIAGAAVVLALSVWWRQLLLGYFAAMGLVEGWKRFQSAVSAYATEAGREAWRLILSGEPAQAEQVAQAALSRPLSAQARANLLELLAWARLAQHDVQGAKDQVALMAAFTPTPELRARLLAADDDVEGVAALLEPLAQTNELPATAVPLLISALVALGAHARVVAVCRALLAKGAQTHKPLLNAVHSSMAAIFAKGDFALALELCVLAFEQTGAPVHAFNCACCLSRLNRLDEGLAWLSRSIEHGYRDLESLQTDADLAALRGLEGFNAIVAQLSRADSRLDR